jgi:iron complex transport system substrate-binding protein
MEGAAMTRRLGLVFLLLTLVIAGCGDSKAETPVDSASAASASFPMTLQSSDGASITLNAAPQRIVSLAPGVTETLCTLGAASQIVAVEKFQNCPAGSSAKPALDAFMPDVEAIAAQKPDLVFTTYNPPGFVEALRKISVPVLYLEVPNDIAGVYDEIELFGRISGKSKEAEELVTSMKDRQDGIVKKVGNATGPRVYHELDTTYFSVGPNSFVGDFYKQLGASNIVTEADGDYPQLSPEVIIQRNPQVIVLADEDTMVTPDEAKQRPGWSVIDAVKNSRVCNVDPDLIERPGPRVVDGLEELAKCLYPEKF